MEIPFVGGAYSGRSTNLNAQVCQNWYLEVDAQEGKSPKALINTPGMLLFSTTGTAAVVRGLYVWKDYLYAVVGGTLYNRRENIVHKKNRRRASSAFRKAWEKVFAQRIHSIRYFAGIGDAHWDINELSRSSPESGAHQG